jgi:hypothetical protein
MKVVEDGVWRYFNCPDPRWSEKCRHCREKVAEAKTPVEECLNCWKVEVWSLGPAMRSFRAQGGGDLPRFAEEQCFLVDALLTRGIPVIAKASRAPILVVRTGIPREAYPSEVTDYLLMLYASNIAERDRLRREAEDVLSQVDVPLGPSLPVRRGCWRYDDLLGPWETWYPFEKDAGPVDAGPVFASEREP